MEPRQRRHSFFEARKDFGSWFAENLLPKEDGGNGHTPGQPRGIMDPAAFDPEEFMRGFSQEIVSLQMMAVMRGVSRQERPIREGGLVPSPDGFRWMAS